MLKPDYSSLSSLTLAVAGLFFPLAVMAPAAVFTIQPQTEAASKDTKVYASVPLSNFSSNLNVVSADITDFRAMVQFDLSALLGLTAGNISSASLRLYSTGLNLNAQSSAASAVVTVSPIFSDWKESPDDAGSAPLGTWSALFGTSPTITYGAVAASQTVTGVGYFDWDITTLVRSWQDGTQANFGLLLQAPGPQGDVGIADTDTPAFAPALIVTSPIPEPSAAVLLMGLCPVLLRRSRHA
jgi:hypothetical protein